MKATFYAQFDKKNSTTARLVATSQNPPRSLTGHVVVRVQLELPDAAFEPLTAEGVIQAGFVGIPIEVEAQPPVEDDNDDNE